MKNPALRKINTVCVKEDRETEPRPWKAYPTRSTPIARGSSGGITFNTLNAMTPTSIIGKIRKAQAGVNVVRSWGLLNQIMSIGKQTRSESET